MSRTDRLRRSAGLTLIEMLLASALLLAAAATAAGFMAQGIKLWAKLSASAQEEDAAACVVKMTRDLRSAADYSLIPFERGETRAAFAALENISTITGDPDPMPYAVSYRLDPQTSRIVREAVYGQTFERPGVTRSETVLDGVQALKFEYEGEPDGIPSKVTVRIEYRGRFGLRSMTREVLLPAAPARTERR